MDHDRLIDLRPENRIALDRVQVGMYRLIAREAATEVSSQGDLELDLDVYMDGTIEIDNNVDPDHGQWRRVRLSPSQVASLKILLNDPTVVRPYRPPS